MEPPDRSWSLRIGCGGTRVVIVSTQLLSRLLQAFKFFLGTLDTFLSFFRRSLLSRSLTAVLSTGVRFVLPLNFFDVLFGPLMGLLERRLATKCIATSSPLG